MKIHSIILFSLLPMLGIAQKNASIEMSSGLNFTDYSNKISSTKGRLNYDFGLAITLPMKNPKRDWFIGLRFMSYGDKYDNSNLRFGSQEDGQGGFNPNAPSGESISSVKFRSSYNYFEIPVGIRQCLTNGKSRLFLQAAIGSSYFLSGRNLSKVSYTTGGSQTGINPDNSDNFRLVNFMADLGFGLEIPVSEKLGLQCQAHGQTQLLDIVSDSYSHAKWYAFGVRAGLRYRLF